jgi:hypothetical protein
MVMNAIYAKVAVALNNWENHRTDTEYEDMVHFALSKARFTHALCKARFNSRKVLQRTTGNHSITANHRARLP